MCTLRLCSTQSIDTDTWPHDFTTCNDATAGDWRDRGQQWGRSGYSTVLHAPGIGAIQLLYDSLAAVATDMRWAN